MKTTNWIFIAFLLIVLLPACEEEKIDIEKYGSITGIVLNGEDYSPLGGVQISTTPASSTMLTDENGRFEFNKVKEGEVAITARKKDFLGNSVTVAVYEYEKTELTFYLLKDEKNVGSVYIYDPVPGNGAVDQKTTLTLQWNVDQEIKSKQLDYTVYYFESGSTVQLIAGENLSAREIGIDDLKENTTYYWYVVAKHEGSIVANSPTWTFKTTGGN